MTLRRRAWLVVASIALVGGVAWLVLPDPDRPYHDLVARMRAAGEPVDYAGLIGEPPRPEENGGPDLAAGRQWLRDNVAYERWQEVVGPWNASCGPDWAETMTPEQAAELAKFVSEIEPALAHWRAAASKPRIAFHDEPKDAFGWPEPGAIPRLQQARQVLVGAAVGSAEESARLDAIATLLGLARIDPDGVGIIDLMVQSTLGHSGAIETRRFAEPGHGSAAAARARIDPVLRSQARWMTRLPDTIRKDCAWAIQHYRTHLDGTFPYAEPSAWERLMTSLKLRKPSPPTFNPFPFPELSARDVVAHCEQLIAVRAVAPGRSFARYRDAVAAAAKRQRFAAAGWDEGPFLDRIVHTLCRNEAATGLARIGLAAAEHRERHGALAATLDDLRPYFPDGLPSDPFTDAPFLYERATDGVRIASLGRAPDEAAVSDADLREQGLVWELKR